MIYPLLILLISAVKYDIFTISSTVDVLCTISAGNFIGVNAGPKGVQSAN
jgi:hypothetical protein